MHLFLQRQQRQGQQGVALLMVLFILVLLSTLAIYTAEDEHMAFRRLENQLDAAQSQQVALAGEQWVIKALERDLLDTSQDADYLGEEWALLQSQVVKVESGEMAVMAIDEAGKFNLNNLLVGKDVQIPDPNAPTGTPLTVPSSWYALFTRLLNNVGLDEIMANAVIDWLDEDDEPTEPEGAEDGFYAGEDPSYLTANQAFTSISELALVKGFDQQAVYALAPYISALPVNVKAKQFTKINLNTAPLLLLQSFDGTVDAEAIGRYLQFRKVTPANNPYDVYSALNLSLDRREFDELSSVKSAYFSAESCAKLGRILYAQKSVLWRDESNEEVHVLSRERRYNCGIVP